MPIFMLPALAALATTGGGAAAGGLTAAGGAALLGGGAAAGGGLAAGAGLAGGGAAATVGGGLASKAPAVAAKTGFLSRIGGGSGLLQMIDPITKSLLGGNNDAAINAAVRREELAEERRQARLREAATNARNLQNLAMVLARITSGGRV